MIKIKIRLFGAFRNYGNGEFVEIEAPTDSNLENIKDLFVKKLQDVSPNFNNHGLITDSVIASDEEILDNKSVISQNCSLAILPPVCGG